jgi:hypothetical protein
MALPIGPHGGRPDESDGPVRVSRFARPRAVDLMCSTHHEQVVSGTYEVGSQLRVLITVVDWYKDWPLYDVAALHDVVADERKRAVLHRIYDIRMAMADELDQRGPGV